MSRVVQVASGREWRGGQRQVLLLAAALAARPDLELIAVTGRQTRLAERLGTARVTVRELAWGPGLDPRVAAHLFAEITADTIVHAHDSHAHALADAAARLRRATLVVTRRVTLPVRNVRRYRRAAAVIAVSHAVRDRLLDAGVDASRIHVIPDAIDPAIFALDDGSAPDAATIVSIAALTPEKGIDVLLEAAALVRAAHPGARWIVLGEGRERQRLEARRAALGLGDVVDLAGFVDAPEQMLQRATIAVQPSRSEGLGSSVLDALALGVPVVAGATGGLPEALGAGGGILVPAGNAVELAGAVSRLLSDAPLRARLGAAGRIAARRFEVPRMVDAVLDVYRSVMRESRS